MINPNTDRPSTNAADPSQVARDGDEIRADMDRTLDALERKFSPGQLLDQSMEFLRENGTKFARGMGDATRRHPLPALLTCAGLVWLTTSLTRSARASARPSAEPAQGEVADLEAESNDGSRIKRTAQAAQDKVQDAVQNVQNRTSEVRDSFGITIGDHPLALGALALAVGAVVGAAIPLTETEKRMIGPAGDRALRKAEEYGERTYGKVRGALGMGDAEGQAPAGT